MSSTFYLVNANDTWLKKNFKFIHAIYAGTNWLHMKYAVIRSPNVYNILCPGRWMMMWAAMDCSITFEGKLRKNPAVAKELSKFTKAIDEDMLFPDAWKISLSIKDLTPNNFNMYANYYMNGYNQDEISKLSEMKGIEDIASELVTYFKGMWEDMKTIGGDVIEAGKNILNNTLDAANSLMSDVKNETATDEEKEKMEKEEAEKKSEAMSQATEAYNKKYSTDLSQENFENLYQEGNQQVIDEYNQTEYGKQQARKAMALAKYNERK